MSPTSTLTEQRPRPLDRRASGSNGAAGRTIRPRKGLPGSRAVVGGLLVALAAVGTWIAASGAGSSSGGRYLVAARLIGPGERIEGSDVRWSNIDLPESLRPTAFDDADGIVGAVALGPIEEASCSRPARSLRRPAPLRPGRSPSPSRPTGRWPARCAPVTAST